MGLYSLGLSISLVVWFLWYLIPLLRRHVWPPGIRERTGHVPERLLPTVAGKRVAWVHAVSVGETLAAQRLIRELGETLGSEWEVVVSTATETGQKLAQERFGAERVFYIPLDFASAWRPFLKALHPEIVVLMESEVWPRMMHECRVRDIPVIVVNARVSDRSFHRSKKVRWIWSRVLRRATLWLTQTEEDARRLVEMGARPEAVRVGGNLKYDVHAPKESPVAQWIRTVAEERRIVVVGSTVADAEGNTEEPAVLAAWAQGAPGTLLVLAPRHPERFAAAEALLDKSTLLKASMDAPALRTRPDPAHRADVVLLDTIGDLAAVYGVADVAFIGGSLVKRGGHNPLEPAQFGVPVIMGPSYENFRDIVGRMVAAEAITIVKNQEELAQAFAALLSDTERARALGDRGRRVFEEQQGATARAVGAVWEMGQR